MGEPITSEVGRDAPVVMEGVAGLREKLGQEVGVSSWRTVEQSDIDTFADLTGDRQWIHVDPERAAAGPFGTTVAHGYLTLSLLPMLGRDL